MKIKKTELLAILLCCLLSLYFFELDIAILLIAILTGAYSISRGIAKSGYHEKKHGRKTTELYTSLLADLGAFVSLIFDTTDEIVAIAIGISRICYAISRSIEQKNPPPIIPHM